MGSVRVIKIPRPSVEVYGYLGGQGIRAVVVSMHTSGSGSVSNVACGRQLRPWEFEQLSRGPARTPGLTPEAVCCLQSVQQPSISLPPCDLTHRSTCGSACCSRGSMGYICPGLCDDPPLPPSHLLQPTCYSCGLQPVSREAIVGAHQCHHGTAVVCKTEACRLSGLSSPDAGVNAAPGSWVAWARPHERLVIAVSWQEASK